VVISTEQLERVAHDAGAAMRAVYQAAIPIAVEDADPDDPFTTRRGDERPLSRSGICTSTGFRYSHQATHHEG
jgi:hypothetical protein